MDAYSEDMVNQITLNCLISKSQLMKLNSNKIKKNIEIERNKKINKYHDKLIKLFENLLNKCELSDVFDDVKTSYVHFIDKAIIYFDNFDEEKINEEKEEKEGKEDDLKKENNEEKLNVNNEENNLFNRKLNSMINECYDKRYYEMMVEEQKQKQENVECQDFFYDDENDEDDEY